MRSLLLLLALCFSVLSAQATDYTYTAPVQVAVLGGFDDTYSYTPKESGTYILTYTVVNKNGGCATKYCHSKWTIHTSVSMFYLTDGTNVWSPPYGGITASLQAGTTYKLRIVGVGTGTGIYANQGQYGVTVTKGY